MLATIFTGTTRYRRWILGAAVVLAASILLLRSASAPHSDVGFALTVSLSLLALVSAVLALPAWLWSRPAALAVDPRRVAFRALPNAGFVYMAAMLTFLGATQIGSVGFLWSFMDTGRGPSNLATDLLGVSGFVLTGLAIGLSAVLFVQVWRGVGVELRPDGLIDRTPVGTLTVPWEALAPGYPRLGNESLVLTYTRPELVRRRHIVLSRRRISTHSIDQMFLGAVIAHYGAYPQHRAAIGTQAEYDRLCHALNIPAGPLPATSR